MTLEKVPFDFMDATIVADSITQQGDRLTTVLVALPPHVNDVVLTLPGCNVTPVYKGWTNEMIVQTTGDLSPPEHLMPSDTPFGRSLVDSAYNTCAAAAKSALEDFKKGSPTGSIAVMNMLSLPFSIQVYMISAVDWFDARLTMEMSKDRALAAFSNFLEKGLAESEPVEMSPSDFHFPFITMSLFEEVVEYVGAMSIDDPDVAFGHALRTATHVSAARCARGGPIDSSGNEVPLEQELINFARLQQDWPHLMSSYGHIASPDDVHDDENGVAHYASPSLHGPLRGWCSARRSQYFCQVAENSKQLMPATKTETKGATLTLIKGGQDG